MKRLADGIRTRLRHTHISTVLAVCLVAILSAFTLNLINTQFGRNYTSDNVANQQIIQSLIKNLGGHAIFPSDSFILHFPLYLLTDSLLHNNTRAKLFLQALVLGVAGLTGIIVSLIYYLKKAGIYHKTSIVLSSLVLVFLFSSPPFAEYALEVNHRLPEAGLALLLLLPLSQLLTPTKSLINKKTVCYACLYILGLGALWFDDPYFMFIMAGGIGITALLFWARNKITWVQCGVTAVIVLASYLVAKFYIIMFEHLAIYQLPNGIFTTVPVSSIFTNIQNTIGAFFANFNASLFDLNLITLSKKMLLSLSAGAVLAFLGIAAFLHAIKTSRSKLFMPQTLLLTTTLVLISSFMLTQTATIPFLVGSRDRYLFFVPILLLPLIIEYLLYMQTSALYRFGQLAIAVLCIGAIALVAGNVYGTALGFTHHRQNAANTENYGLIDILRRAGYTKGYADYWDGQINTYLSNGTVHFVQVVCIEGVLSPYHWMVDNADYTIKANKTFYVLDPSVNDPSSCTIQKISKQYGPPEHIVTYNNNDILFYNRDILSGAH